MILINVWDFLRGNVMSVDNTSRRICPNDMVSTFDYLSLRLVICICPNDDGYGNNTL